jgi:DNA-binding NtrC family response regulator
MLLSTDSPGEIAGTLIGSSAAAAELRREAALAAQCGMRVLVTGEYGVGKQRLARLIHRQSLRCHAPFIALPCAHASEQELETRLFGNAHTNVLGVIERADGGTLFLEDIDWLSLAMQRRVMNFIVHGEVQPVGTQPMRRRANVRIITATTTPLVEAVATGRFRPDLYYLLNTIYVPVPALRERAEDVEPLLDFFTAYYARRYGRSVPQIPLESRARCRAHSWPGNLRQLQAVAAMFTAPTQAVPAAAILASAADASLCNRDL